jgi:hypothetical protein
MYNGKIFIRTDFGKDKIRLGLLHIFLMRDKLGKQWPTPDSMLMEINQRPGAKEDNGNCPGNKNTFASFGVKTHLTFYR